MKKEISPMFLVGAILVGLIALTLIGFRVWSAPSVLPAPEVAQAAVADGPARGSGQRAGGGPTPDALRYRDEYNRTHPDAAGSR
jgi:hypothetical protein